MSWYKKANKDDIIIHGKDGPVIISMRELRLGLIAIGVIAFLSGLVAGGILMLFTETIQTICKYL